MGARKDKIKRLRAAIKEQKAQKDWLESVEWGDGTTSQTQQGDNLTSILAEHDRIIAMYEGLIEDAHRT